MRHINDPTVIEQQFQRLVNGLKDYSIFMLDTQGRVTTWNEGARRLNGYEPAEIIGRHFSAFFPPNGISTYSPDQELSEARQCGHFEAEDWRQRKDGSRFWAHVTITAMRADNGTLEGFSTVTRDLTERKRQEVRLKDAEAKFRGLLATAPDAIVIVKEDGRIVFVNEQAEKFFGYERTEMLGQLMEMLLPERFRGGHAHQRSRYMEHPTLRPMGVGRELFGRRKDGSEFPVDIALSPLRTEAGLLISSAIRDVSDRRALEKEKEELLATEQRSRTDAESAARMRDELVAMVSHDLKNPLSSILLGIQLIEKMDSIDDRGKSGFERIRHSAERMKRMIEELLDAHTIESGRFQLTGSRAASHAHVIAEQALERQQMLAQQKNLTLKRFIAEGLPQVSVEFERIQQVLQNLLSNAIKFTPEGGVIELRVEAQGPDVLFSVVDNGPGIEGELLPHIFERFSQEKKTARLGSGLGLSIAKAIIEAHDGRIWVESADRKGSAFRFTLPAVAGAISVPAYSLAA